MKQIILYTFLFFITLASFAEGSVNIKKTSEKEIKGKVTDEFDEPLAGVIVENKDLAIFTVTDSEGRYKILSSEDSQLIFKFLENSVDTISTSYRTIVNYKLMVDAN